MIRTARSDTARRRTHPHDRVTPVHSARFCRIVRDTDWPTAPLGFLNFRRCRAKCDSGKDESQSSVCQSTVCDSATCSLG